MATYNISLRNREVIYRGIPTEIGRFVYPEYQVPEIEPIEGDYIRLTEWVGVYLPSEVKNAFSLVGSYQGRSLGGYGTVVQSVTNSNPIWLFREDSGILLASYSDVPTDTWKFTIYKSGTIPHYQGAGPIQSSYRNRIAWAGLMAIRFGNNIAIPAFMFQPGTGVDMIAYAMSECTSNEFGALYMVPCEIGVIPDNFDYRDHNVDLIPFFSEIYPPEEEDTDPFTPGGNSSTGGGSGTFTGGGSDVGIPGLPTLSAVDTGFITLYTPSVGQLQSLANYMWSDLFSLDTFKKLFADPMDAILGLSIVPCGIPSSGARSLTVGNISTGVSINVADSQYIVVDCGSVYLPEYWGAYLDYDPFTEIDLFLPYIGAHAVKADDVMGKTTHIVYHVDILNGSCIAFVEVNGTVIYTFIGACANCIPISGNSFANVLGSVIQIAGSIGMMAATGGLSAVPGIATAAGRQALSAVTQAGTSAAGATMNMKPQVEKSGSMSGPAGILGNQTPFFVLLRPNQALPARQNAYTGYPSFITENLGDLSGYTEVEYMHLENIPCTQNELSEIEMLLKGGVIF